MENKQEQETVPGQGLAHRQWVWALTQRGNMCVLLCMCVCLQAQLGYMCMSGCIFLNMDIKKKPKQNKKRVAFGIPTIQAFNPGLGHLVIDMVIKIKKP